jgi:putative chitinase
MIDLTFAIRAAAAAERFATPLYRPLQLTCDRYQISAAAPRAAAFLAQCGHESAGFRYLRELGSDAYLDKYDTGKLAQRLGNTPEDDNDGQLYRGRGIIQITGRANYRAAGEALGLPLLENPKLAELPEHAATIAGWYWDSRHLNDLADHDGIESFKAITRKINGGLNGLADRFARLNELRAVFGLPEFDL